MWPSKYYSCEAGIGIPTPLRLGEVNEGIWYGKVNAWNVTPFLNYHIHRITKTTNFASTVVGAMIINYKLGSYQRVPWPGAAGSIPAQGGFFLKRKIRSQIGWLSFFLVSQSILKRKLILKSWCTYLLSTEVQITEWESLPLSSACLICYCWEGVWN